MRKQGLKLTGKVLAGLVLFSGITAVPTKAIDVQPAAVDVNVKNVKASVYEKEGHFYAKLVADKEVANVVARITTENKAQFLLKRDIIKAGEEVVVELDMKAQVPTRKLPHTGVKKESFNTVTKLSGHTFKIAEGFGWSSGLAVSAGFVCSAGFLVSAAGAEGFGWSASLAFC